MTHVERELPVPGGCFGGTQCPSAASAVAAASREQSPSPAVRSPRRRMVSDLELFCMRRLRASSSLRRLVGLYLYHFRKQRVAASVRP